MKRIRLVLLLMAALLLFSAQSTFAVPIKIVTNDLFADGTLYPFSPLGAILDDSDGDGIVDSWAVARVTEILADMDYNGVYETTMFDNSTSAYELTVYAYGFDDALIVNSFAGGANVNQLLRTVGGTLNIYQDYTKDYNPTDINNDGAGGTALEIAANTSPVTDGTLWLQLQGSLIDGYTLTENLNNYSRGYSGSMYFDVIGGSQMGAYDSDSQDYGTDVFYSFSAIIFPNADGQIGGNWDSFDDGTAITAMVPEPGMLLLLGMGLLGIGVARRFRS